MALEVVCRLLFTEKVDVEQVIAKIDVQCERIAQQEPETGAEVNGEAVVAGKARRPEAADQVQAGVVRTTFTDECLAGQYVVAEVQVVIGQRPLAVRQKRGAAGQQLEAGESRFGPADRALDEETLGQVIGEACTVDRL